MKRVLIGAVTLLVGVAMALIMTKPNPQESHLDSRFGSAGLPIIAAPETPAPLPKAKFSRTIWTSTKLAEIDAALDRCRGPVSADLGDGEPVFIAEHDYCGGSAWMWKLGVRDIVALKGSGVDAGLYVVSKLRYFPRKSGATVANLPRGDVVLQTCVSSTRMVFIALTKYVVVG